MVNAMRKAGVLSILCVVVLLAVVAIAEAQKQQEVYRVGILRSDTAASANQQIEVFTEALRELGYVNGRTSYSNAALRREFLSVCRPSRPS